MAKIRSRAPSSDRMMMMAVLVPLWVEVGVFPPLLPVGLLVLPVGSAEGAPVCAELGGGEGGGGGGEGGGGGGRRGGAGRRRRRRKEEESKFLKQ